MPVQQWIAEARRSRDLRVGSALLSYLMARVLQVLETEAGAKIRVPDWDKGSLGQTFLDALQKDEGEVPNRATGYCRSAIFEKLQEDVIEAEWSKLGDEHLVRLGEKARPEGKHEDREEAWILVSPWLEEYRASLAGESDCPFSLIWVAKWIDGEPPKDEETFREHLVEIDRLYREVKRTRPARVTRGAPVGKCGQCGRREAIGPRDGFKAWRDQQRKLDELAWVKKGYVLDEGERLCWLCLTRRLVGYAGALDRFPSTGAVASAPWRKAILEAGGKPKELLDKIMHLGRRPGADIGRVLYLSKGSKIRDADSEVVCLLEELRSEIGSYNQRCKQDHRLETAPPQYLALLTFDGDNMGAEIHREPSKVPSKMADLQRSLRNELKTSEAKGLGIFYFGGDEGLLMTPAVRALEVVHQIRELFTEQFRDLKAPPTLSAGIAFFDQSRPMKGAIEAARRALTAAKENPGKNALGVGVETASGSQWLVARGWGPFWERIRNAVALVKEGRLASGWAYDVERLIESLPQADWLDAHRDPAPLRSEVKRLLFRRLILEAKESSEELRSERDSIWETSLSGESLFSSEEMAPLGDSRADLAASFHLIGFLVRQSGLEVRERGEERGEDAA